jgi:hypothetical protein
MDFTGRDRGNRRARPPERNIQARRHRDRAACAMLAVVYLYDDVSWGGETQALIYNPHTRKVIESTRWVSPDGCDTGNSSRQSGIRLKDRWCRDARQSGGLM